MKIIIILLQLIFILQISFSQSILDPKVLEYEFYDVVTADDGTKMHAYIAKNNKPNKDGDYGWSKAIPIYSGHGVEVVYEYQMNFTDIDYKFLKEFLINELGTSVIAKSWDNPLWYNDDMSLTEIYNYCKNNSVNITLLHSSVKNENMLIKFDIGSSYIDGEITLIYMFLKE